MQASTFTELIDIGRRGDSVALNLAYRLVFRQLRQSAARLLDREGHCITLQPTALVSELYLRIHRIQCRIMNREHFLALATRSMKRHLIDRGRGKAVRRRLDPEALVSFAAPTQPATAAQLATRTAWERLKKIDAPAAATVWLMKVEGMTINEVATRQKRPAWRVIADCDFAVDWLAKQLR